jgi:hypothetical protein
MAMAKRKSDDDIISTRLRLPVGVHRMVTDSAKKNNRSINSEILWALAHYLGGSEAQKLVQQMAVEQRRRMQRLLEIVYKDPERAAKALEEIEEREEGK